MSPSSNPDLKESEPRPKVLIVDDTETNRIAFEVLLAPLGFDLHLASSGLEAARLSLDHDYAVILMDVRMPDLDGFETARMIRSREMTRHTPILFMTAQFTSRDLVLRAYAGGAIDFLLTPIDPEILTLKVTAFVHLYDRLQSLRRIATDLAAVNRKLQIQIAGSRQIESGLRQTAFDLQRALGHLQYEVTGFSTQRYG